MKMLTKIMASAAAASLAIAPAMAAPVNPASSLSVAKVDRAGATTTNGSNLRGRRGGFFIAGIAAIIVIVAIVIIASNNNDNPKSP